MDSHPSTNPALFEFWDTPARNRVLYGGRASSKSWDAAANVIWIAQMARVRVLCVRQYQNKIEESVYTLLKIQIERYKVGHKFRVLDNKIICITTGSEFMFYGLWRNIGELKSMESIDILWSEESHLLSQEQWEILEPTIRAESSECWFIFNPRFSNDFVYERFVLDPPARTLVRKINYDENPFLSKTMMDLIEDAKDKPWFDHVYGGMPRDGTEFFKLENMLVDGKGVIFDKPVDTIFAVIDTATKTGKEHDGTAVIYCAITKHYGYPLLILDWDITQIEGALLEAWLPNVYANLESLSRQYKARLGCAGVFIEDKASGMVLLQQAARRGWKANPIDSKLTAVGKDERAISVSGYVFRNMVKLTDHAHNKTCVYKGISRNHLISQVTSFRPGDKEAFKRMDDLLDCFSYSLSIALGNNEGF